MKTPFLKTGQTAIFYLPKGGEGCSIRADADMMACEVYDAAERALNDNYVGDFYVAILDAGKITDVSADFCRRVAGRTEHEYAHKRWDGWEANYVDGGSYPEMFKHMFEDYAEQEDYARHSAKGMTHEQIGKL
jgi:hypothetical protein